MDAGAVDFEEPDDEEGLPDDELPEELEESEDEPEEELDDEPELEPPVFAPPLLEADERESVR